MNEAHTIHSTGSLPNIVNMLSAPELLQEVFLYLKLDDLKNVRLVCKQWREVTFLPRLNDNIVVTLAGADANEVSRLISSGFKISCLKFSKEFQLNDFCTSSEFSPSLFESLKTLLLYGQSFGIQSKLGHLLSCCPNLENLSFWCCSGMNSIKERKSFGFKLKELAIDSCDHVEDSIVSLITSLAVEVKDFAYEPKYPNNLRTDKFTDLFRLMSKTLIEVDITWFESPGGLISHDLDFHTMFGVPGLKLKTVFLRGKLYFDGRLDALVRHQGNSLEEIYMFDYEFNVEDQLRRVLTSYLPNLRVLHGHGSLSEDSKRSALTLLNSGLGEFCPSLREIYLNRMVLLKRKTAVERFVPFELSVKFDDLSEVAGQDEIVASFLHGRNLNFVTKLQLKNVDLSHRGMTDVIFAECTSLTELRLNRCNLSDAMLMNGTERSLQTVWDGSDALLDGTSFPILNLTRLEKLVLSDNVDLTGFSVSHCTKFPRLRTLKLNKSDSFCDIQFARLALNNPLLEEVNFSEINLTDRFITEFVHNAPNLINLSLHGNPLLTKYGICDIAKHKKLRTLLVINCPKITSDVVRFVKERNADLRVLTGY